MRANTLVVASATKTEAAAKAAVAKATKGNATPSKSAVAAAKVVMEAVP